jgi:hypothetical protein
MRVNDYVVIFGESRLLAPAGGRVSAFRIRQVLVALLLLFC